ncbi:MAG: oligopeptide ABC transporter ATP-binding protein OppF, partial [Deltaproteobacteria bacterium]|nr:oligopeptide ABC transporter ATP-binding protein OppF [Deltaproteobacteria bacterium]
MTTLLQLSALRKHFDLGHGRVLQAVDGVTLHVAERE